MTLGLQLEGQTKTTTEQMAYDVILILWFICIQWSLQDLLQSCLE